jgi:hypothetical protein
MMIPGEDLSVSDDTSAREAHELQVEAEKSRESAARLLDTLARKVGGHRVVRDATSGIERAGRHMQSLSVKDVAIGIGRAVRSRPASAMALAVVAGFLIGRALRSR